MDTRSIFSSCVSIFYTKPIKVIYRHRQDSMYHQYKIKESTATPVVSKESIQCLHID